MRALGSFPSGLVTFVFTDIEGSTQLLRRIGDRYPPLLERHREILREAWTAWGGCEVKTDGDSFFVAFSDPIAAIEACAQGQRAITAESWPADAVFRVRIGVHSGLASPRDDDYVALAVHQAARVVDAGHGGQVVVSSDTAERVDRRSQDRAGAARPLSGPRFRRAGRVVPGDRSWSSDRVPAAAGVAGRSPQSRRRDHRDRRSRRGPGRAESSS